MRDLPFKLYLKAFNLAGKRCHQRADRSFHIGNWQFSNCARCTGIIFGQILMLVLLPFGIRTHFLFDLACLFLLFIDWGLQYVKILESNNLRRVVTGALGGIAEVSLIFKAFYYIYVLVSKWV